jgi:hypothetical protein
MIRHAALRSPARAYVFDPSDPWVERAERFIQSREKVSKRTGREIKDKGAVNIMRGLLAALRSPEPAAEPVAWGVWENSHFQFADHNEVAARAMAEDIRGFPDCRGEVEVRALYAHPPSAEPATGRDRSQGVTEQELASAGGEPRYTLDEVADMLDANVHSVKPGWMNAALWLRHEGTCGGPVYRRPDTLAEVADLIERREYGPGIGEEGLAIARWLRSGGATTEMGGDDQ